MRVSHSLFFIRLLFFFFEGGVGVFDGLTILYVARVQYELRGVFDKIGGN